MTDGAPPSLLSSQSVGYDRRVTVRLKTVLGSTTRPTNLPRRDVRPTTASFDWLRRPRRRRRQSSLCRRARQWRHRGGQRRQFPGLGAVVPGRWVGEGCKTASPVDVINVCSVYQKFSTNAFVISVDVYYSDKRHVKCSKKLCRIARV